MKKGLIIFTCDPGDTGMTGFCCVLDMATELTTFEEAVNSLLPTLSSAPFVKELIEKDFLEDDLFEGEPYEFVSCGYRNYALEYEFKHTGNENADVEEIVIKSKGLDFVDIWQPISVS